MKSQESLPDGSGSLWTAAGGQRNVGGVRHLLHPGFDHTTKWIRRAAGAADH